MSREKDIHNFMNDLNINTTEYKGFLIVPIEWQYGNEKYTEYEIHKTEENRKYIYYKDNGVTPATATVGDAEWGSIDDAKRDIDNGTLIKGGVYVTDEKGNLHFATFKAFGKIWHCDHCGKDHFDDKVKPKADTEEYGLICEHCFNRLLNKGKNFHFELSPIEYDYEIKR